MSASKGKKKNFTNYLADEFADEESPQQRQNSILNLKSSLASALSTGAEPQKFFSLAEKCFEYGLEREHDIALERAAHLGHHEAAFIYASLELAKHSRCNFLSLHCSRNDADPRCLVLLAQSMENSEYDLEFSADTCLGLFNRAIQRARALGNTKTWRNALFLATTEKARLILNYNLGSTPSKPAWLIARETMQPFMLDSKMMITYGLKSLEKMDYYTLMGRIADQAKESQLALTEYRKALSIAEKIQEPIGFLKARIATLTTDAEEARLLLPGAISWLDDRGIGKNDDEMPDLVSRYTQIYPVQAIQRIITNPLPSSSHPQPVSLPATVLVSQVTSTLSIPPASVSDVPQIFPSLTTSQVFFSNSPQLVTIPGFTVHPNEYSVRDKRCGSDDIFPAAKRNNFFQ